MKILYKLFLAVALVFSFSCQAQIMHNLSDVQKLKEHEDLFIGKPLKTLLKEIGPQIRMASAISNRPAGMPSLIFFKFIPAKEYNKKAKEKKYTTVIAYIKENFDWDELRNSKNKQNYEWTNEDEKKFGNLTVVGIGVLNEK